MRRLARHILARGRMAGAMLATAESCTGGLVAAALTELPGSSEIFAGGFVTYSDAMKTGALGVPADLITLHGAVSEPVARAMAEGARLRAQATLAVSITGIAGPGGSAFKPEGRVCFGVATVAGCMTETVEFGALGRDGVRRAARDHALGLLLAALR